jgi:hypothetical protein
MQIMFKQNKICYVKIVIWMTCENLYLYLYVSIQNVIQSILKRLSLSLSLSLSIVYIYVPFSVSIIYFDLNKNFDALSIKKKDIWTPVT